MGIQTQRQGEGKGERETYIFQGEERVTHGMCRLESEAIKMGSGMWDGREVDIMKEKQKTLLGGGE